MITEATIYVSNYDKTLSFYKRLFRNKLSEVSNKEFKIKLPWNTLHVIKEDSIGEPFYHYCFLIPKSLFDQAKNYVSNMVELNTQDGEDEISFIPSIRSFYFYDPSGNVVEFMGKDSNDNPSQETFSPHEILGISEMSLVTDDLSQTASKLYHEGILEKAPSEINQDGLTFISSGETTLLLSPTDRVWVFSEKVGKVFPQSIKMDGKEIKVDQRKNIHIS